MEKTIRNLTKLINEGDAIMDEIRDLLETERDPETVRELTNVLAMVTTLNFKNRELCALLMEIQND